MGETFCNDHCSNFDISAEIKENEALSNVKLLEIKLAENEDLLSKIDEMKNQLKELKDLIDAKDIMLAAKEELSESLKLKIDQLENDKLKLEADKSNLEEFLEKQFRYNNKLHVAMSTMKKSLAAIENEGMEINNSFLSISDASFSRYF